MERQEEWREGGKEEGILKGWETKTGGYVQNKVCLMNSFHKGVMQRIGGSWSN